MRRSSSTASRLRWPSWPSSQAKRNWRPLMLTVTCEAALAAMRRGCSAVIGLQHGSDGVDGDVEAARDLAVGGLERARARNRVVEIGGELGAIGSERVQLRGERLLA